MTRALTWHTVDVFLTPLLLCQNPQHLQACQPQLSERLTAHWYHQLHRIGCQLLKPWFCNCKWQCILIGNLWNTEPHCYLFLFNGTNTWMCGKTDLQNCCFHPTPCLYFHYIQQSQALNLKYHALQYFNGVCVVYLVKHPIFHRPLCYHQVKNSSTAPGVKGDLKSYTPRQWSSKQIHWLQCWVKPQWTKNKLNSSLNSDKPIILINHLSYGTALQEKILDKEWKQTQKYM